MLYFAIDKSKTASGYYRILEEKVKMYTAWRQVTSNKIQSDTKEQGRLKNPTKIEEIQEKKFIDRN